MPWYISNTALIGF